MHTSLWKYLHADNISKLNLLCNFCDVAEVKVWYQNLGKYDMAIRMIAVYKTITVSSIFIYSIEVKKVLSFPKENVWQTKNCT